MSALAPSKPGEVVTADPSVGGMIEKFKARMAGDTPSAKPEKPAAIVPVPPVPAPPPPAPVPPPAPAPVKPEEKSVVPKLEPLAEKKPAPTLPPAEPPKGEPIPEKLSHKNFKEILAARDEFRTKYEAAERRAKEIEAKLQEQSTRTPPELEETKKLLAEKDHFINQFMLEQSEEFQNAFVRPIEQTISDAKEVVGGGEKGDRLADILRAPDGKWKTDRLKEFVSELEDDYEKGAVREAANALRKLERSRKDELSKAGTNVQALKQMHLKRAEEQAAQQKEMRTRLVQSSLNEAAKALPEFQEGEDTAHNAAVAENRVMLQSFLSDDLPPHEFGRMAAWAVRGYRSLAKENQLNERIATLEAEIQKLLAASPGLGDGGGGSESREKADTPEKMGERFMRASQQGVPGR